VDAWKAGGSQLAHASGHAINNLITEIAQPWEFDPAWLKLFNPMSVGGADRLSVVASVLFPSRSKLRGESRKSYYARHSRILERARKSRRVRSAWGSTYFERLVSFEGTTNQIERAVAALSSWPKRSSAAIVMHTSAPHMDGLRTRGSPCLQYLEVLWNPDDSLDLVAVYRNHDFVNKALGNFLGLARLLQSLADESGKPIGKLVCHSVHAYADRVTQLRALLTR